MQIRFITIVIFFSFALSFSYSQDLPKNKFVVMTYVDDYSKSFHGKQNYFWIIPVDSIKSFNSVLYPLYLSSYSKSHFLDCLAGKRIDPDIPNLKPGDHDFDSSWYSSHDKLGKLLYKKKKLIQTIVKTGYKGNKETIKIYATPIVGQFCSCIFLVTTQNRGIYEGKIYLADNSFQWDSDFWESVQANFVLKQDFSNLNFKRIRYTQ